MIDRYRRRLAHAKWTWNEGKHCRWHYPLRRKEREEGRHDKRAAKQEDRLEIARDREDG